MKMNGQRLKGQCWGHGQKGRRFHRPLGILDPTPFGLGRGVTCESPGALYHVFHSAYPRLIHLPTK